MKGLRAQPQPVLPTPEEFKIQLESALKLVVPYYERDPKAVLGHLFKDQKLAAVLLVFGFEKGTPRLLFTQRTQHLDNHKGQIAFPGGFCEPEDQGDPITTALREAEEEVGIPRDEIEVIGRLAEYPTSTGFLIQPIVGVLKNSIDTVELKLNDFEIDHIFWVELETLLSKETYRQESVQFHGYQVPIHVFQVNQHRIWGATGAITKNILDRLQNLR